MRVIVNDANILIDLLRLDLIQVFCSLDKHKLVTTDFVFQELLDEQKDILNTYINNGSFTIIESTDQDVTDILTLYTSTKGLSFEDCSVWFHAKKCEGILLTGDAKLRKQSTSDGVEVRGILFIFDELLISELITFELAIEKLQELYAFNNRLPQSAKNDRLEKWSQFRHV